MGPLLKFRQWTHLHQKFVCLYVCLDVYYYYGVMVIFLYLLLVILRNVFLLGSLPPSMLLCQFSLAHPSALAKTFNHSQLELTKN